MQTWDFVIVGGGMAGCSVAWQLAQSGQATPPSILVLERESQPGYHTTGRSAALYDPQYGSEQVKALTRASRAMLDHPPAGFATAPLLTPRGVLYVARADQQELFDQAFAEARRHTQRIERLSAAQMHALVPCLDTQLLVNGFLDPDASDIDVHGLHQGFIRGLKQRGGQLWTQAEVTALAYGSDGCGREGWSITLADGRQLRAGTVVNAAGAWADALGALAGAAPIALTPKRRSAFTFAAPEGLDATHWPMVIGIAEDFYFKPDAGQLLGSPANADPVPPQDVMPEELDIATGIHHIEAHTSLRIRRPSHTWAGLRSFVADGNFVIGWDASPTPVSRFFWVAAQGGYGIQSAPGYSLLARNLLLEEPLDALLQAQEVDAQALSPRRCQRLSS